MKTHLGRLNSMRLPIARVHQSHLLFYGLPLTALIGCLSGGPRFAIRTGSQFGSLHCVNLSGRIQE